ncbi:hypothetical protein PF004_g5294 [Phytophthora fragariae]|uniref:Uncharacterized protein n=1 Tax=Phytophthora fragariae TaxID=53985 RepID=A0A6G0PFY5_9STRA|nr:hypothetical protein PF004_g5294 [Phytophthora fragariae]KAE9344085.1 hypothetical protein PF008_g9400 [Phytophthora fragariae]
MTVHSLPEELRLRALPDDHPLVVTIRDPPLPKGGQGAGDFGVTHWTPSSARSAIPAWDHRGPESIHPERNPDQRHPPTSQPLQTGVYLG